jgi:hypothetical protein
MIFSQAKKLSELQVSNFSHTPSLNHIPFGQYYSFKLPQTHPLYTISYLHY